MLRTTLTRRNSFGHNTFQRMMVHLKKRDPNARHLRVGYQLLEIAKRTHAYFLAIVFVVSATTYRQLSNTNGVPVPVQDGRSLVT